MATITWTGAVSSSFFNASNWDTDFVPGSGDEVVVGFEPTANILSVGADATIGVLQLNGPMSITAGTLTVSGDVSVADNSLAITGTARANFGSLSVTAGGGVGVAAGAQLTVAGHTYVNEGMNISGIGSIDPALNGTAVFSTLQIEAGATFSNAGILVVNNSSDTINSTGVLQNTGYVNLVAGALNGRISNDGQINVLGDFMVAEYQSGTNATLLLSGAFATMSNSQFQGDITVVLDSDPANNGRVFVNGMISIGLQSLVIDANAGALSEGSSHTIFTSGSTAMDAFSVANYAVLGQAEDFAYALQLTGIDTAVGSLNLIALNDGATGGRAVLEDSATSRAITLAINSDTGRGTIRGGGFADLHNSLLHGVDEVRSGSGDDVLAVSGGVAGFTLRGNEGDDRLTGRVGNDQLFGGADNDTLIGGSGNDLLSGGTGVDRMVGGFGNDIYIVNSTADVVVEKSGGGTDLVRSFVSLTLAAQVENGTAYGSAAINLTGNGLGNRLSGNTAANRLFGVTGNDTLNGGAGNDTLDGGAGADAMIGGAGDDVFLVDNINDTVSDSSGTDLIRTSVSFTLTSGIENGTIVGSGAVTLTGNGLNNRLVGNAENNILRGGSGRDTLTGARGDDTLTGGAGSDTFVFVRGHGQDRITDFVAAGAGSDKIDLSGHSQITSFADLTANHLSVSGSAVLITAGTDAIRLVNVQLADLNATDFIF